MKKYNGHRSWNAWNVSLWIGNDELLYRIALDCIQTGEQCSRTKTKASILRLATRDFLSCIGYYSKTPDGAVYNPLCVKLALESFMGE